MTKLATLESVIEELEKDPEFAERQADAKPSREAAMLLVRARLQLGLSQAEFAKNAGVSQAYISSLESGASNPSIRALARVLRKNGITLRMEATVAEPPAAQAEPSTLRSARSKASEKPGRLTA